MPDTTKATSGGEGRQIRPLPAVMSVSDAAQELPVGEETICALIRRGELPASGLGTDKNGKPCAPYAIVAEDLLGFLRARRIAMPERPRSESASRHDPAVGGNHSARRRKSTRQARKLVTARSPR
jgi:hypothetical protein